MSDNDSSDRPNLLVVSLDSLRRDYCTIYNPDEATTPFLATLDDTTVFDRAISPSAWTLQVHGSIFTGLYPPEHGVLDQGTALGDHPTLAERLSESGYSTKSFGNNGWLESGEILRGYDHHRPNVSAHVGLQLKQSKVGLRERDAAAVVDGFIDATAALLEKIKRPLCRHRAVDSASVDLLLDHLEDEDGPFSYFLHANDVHYVYNPTAPYHKTFGDYGLGTVLRNYRYQRRLVDQRASIYTEDFEFDSEADDVLEDLYRCCIRQTDALLERLFGELERRGLRENTVVVIFGDHGDHLCDDEHFGHQFSIADQLIRVPLVVVDPTDTFESGVRSDVVQLNDLYPTLASLLGVEVPETMSVDLTTSTRSNAFVYYSAPGSFIDRLEARVDKADLPPSRQYAVWQSPERKLCWYPDEAAFDGPMADDETLRELLRDHEESLVPLARRDDGEMSDSVEQNLRELGYL